MEKWLDSTVTLTVHFPSTGTDDVREQALKAFQNHGIDLQRLGFAQNLTVDPAGGVNDA